MRTALHTVIVSVTLGIALSTPPAVHAAETLPPTGELIQLALGFTAHFDGQGGVGDSRQPRKRGFSSGPAVGRHHRGGERGRPCSPRPPGRLRSAKPSAPAM